MSNKSLTKWKLILYSAVLVLAIVMLIMIAYFLTAILH